jgi:hypothetical protein
MSAITDIAEAVKDELNAGSFGQTFTAERHYKPSFDLPDMKTLHVSVVPKGLAMQATTRSSAQHDVQIDIAVQKKFTAGDNAELDPLMELVEEIADFFKQRRLDAYPQAVWVKTENAPIYAAEHMDELRQFTSVLTLTYRVLR